MEWIPHGPAIEITDVERLCYAVSRINYERLDKRHITEELQGKMVLNYDVFAFATKIYLTANNGKCNLSICYNPKSLYGLQHAKSLSEILNKESEKKRE